MITELVRVIMSWLPGCSPEVPETWQQATLQAFTCFVRLVTACVVLYFVVRLAIEATH